MIARARSIVGVLVTVGALAGCNGASPCGTLAGAVSGTISNCSNSSAIYNQARDTTSVSLSAEGPLPVSGAIQVSFSVAGRPAAGTFHDGDAALGSAQVQFATSDGHQYDADWAGGQQAGVGHLTIVIDSVTQATGQYVVHGTCDATTLEDSAGPACTAHVNF